MPAPATAASSTPAAATAELANLPYRFEVNQGQTDAQVQFLSHGPGYTLFLTAGGATLALPDPAHPGHGTAVRMDLLGANPHATAAGLEQLATTSNYFIGSDPNHWQTDVPNFARVEYQDIYPGIDLVYYGSQSNGTGPQQLEFDFVVHPGADPHAIHLAFAGADQTTLDTQGNLVLHTASGDLTEHTPVLYQEVAGTPQPVSGHFVDLGSGQFSFAVGAYDPSQTLVLDPAVSYATYLGGSGSDSANAVAVDSAGNAYCVGTASSTNFPVTSGAYQTSNHGGTNVFISKLTAGGTSLAYSTYLGGSANDTGKGIGVDSSGNVYVTGSAASGGAIAFPTTSGAFQTSFGGGGTDAFVTKLNAAGNDLVYSTLYGGNGNDVGNAIAVDSSGRAYITGSTTSTNLSTSSPLQVSNGGGTDAFVAEFNGAGTGLVYASYLGGSGIDIGNGITVDGSGRIFITGLTTSPNFPTASAYQSISGGGQDAFVTALAASGSSYLFSTYVGGSGIDSGNAIAVDASGNVFVTGSTNSPNFVTSSGAYQTSLGASGATNAFVTRLSSSGAVTASTYLGGSLNDMGLALTVTAAGDVVAAGTSFSSDFPTVNAVQPIAAGGSDAFLARMSNNLTALRDGTYWGGSGSEDGYGVAVDASGAAYLVGDTTSSDLGHTSWAYQTSLGGSGATNAFVVKMNLPALPAAYAPDASGLIQTTAGAEGGNPAGLALATTGVRYSDGTVFVAQNDLASGGFGTPWGQDRLWTNNAGYDAHSSNGSGITDADLPYLLAAKGTNTIVVVSGGSARYFDLVGATYQERFFGLDTLTHSGAPSNQFTLTDSRGDQLVFNDFANSLPVEERGQLKSYTDPYGNVTNVTSYTSEGLPAEVQRSNTTGSTTITESYLYSYLSSGVNAGLLASVTLRRKVNSGSWTTVRQVVYTYYDGTTSHGNAGDLQLAQVEDGSGNVLANSYYRYYTSESGGYLHALKYVFTPQSYARLAAVFATPTTATDAQVAPYADSAFQYDSQGRVSQAVIAGGGTTYGTGNGLGTYTYSYSSSTNPAGFNSWQTKTTETLPDGNQNIVYTNAYGEVMLSVYHDVPSGSNWESYYQYDSSGRLILTAAPSAISGYDDTRADLLNKVNGNYQYLNDNTGLLTLYDYYSSTTATSSTAGGVAGYQQDTKIQQGELGTAILQNSVQYVTHTAGGVTIAPVATGTVYRNTDGSGGEMTSTSYTWSGSSNGVQSRAVTLPTVTTSENGPGTPDTTTTFYDGYGRPIWTQDGDGFLTYTAYDQATGAVVKTIDDVNTANTSDFSNLPSGWSTPTGGGLHLITQMQVDALGRTTKLTDPDGNITYTVYDDVNHAFRTYAGWNSSTNLPTGPTQVVRQDWTNSYTEMLTMTATPHLTGNLPDGTEAIASVVTLERTYTDSAGQDVRSDAYFNLSGLTYATTDYIGTVNTNYYTTLYGYDVDGRQDRVQSPTGTITRTVYDGQGRVVSSWVGTNDTPLNGTWSPNNNTGSANMIAVNANVYDGGGVGDGNLTQVTVSPGGSAANRVTQQYFDWRDRLVATKDGVQASEDTTTHRPITYTTFDNLDEVTKVQEFDGDGVTISTSNGVPQAPSASLLRAQTTSSFDEQGRVYQTQVYSVDPSSGSVSTNALTTNDWYNHRGELIAESDPGGVVTKKQYDGAGRVTVTYTTDGAGGSSWTAAGSVSGDDVLQQVEPTYDSDSNVILTTTRQRNHDETATGALGNATTGTKARVSYDAAYYDAANRLTATVDVGTNGGSAYTRPGTVPSASDTVLVVSYGYNNAGWVSTVTDPRGIIATTSYDNLGRTTQTIENYTDGNPTSNSNKTTQYTYDGDHHQLTVKALEPGGAYETTQFVYGVTTAGGNDFNSNDVLAAVQYPDKSTGNPSSSQQVSYTVDALGETKTATDRNGSVHTFSYDVLGRETSDAVTTLGSAVDGAVRRLQTAYDTQGNPYLVTSFDAASGGNIVNQVQDVFNGLGQLTGEYQSHSGAVNTSTTPEVQYAYTAMSGGVNNSRLISLTYPNGRVLNYNYASGLDSSISRLTSLSDSSGTLQTYSYLGSDTPVIITDPQPGIALTYVKQTGENNGDGGDQYTGLDRFGRVVDQRWLVTSTGTATDRFQYGYDRDGNRLYRNNLVNSVFSELYHANGSGNGYDNLNQLTAFARGTLNGSNDTIASPSHSQSWTLDVLGNWSSVTTDGNTQNRTFNQQNEVTGVGSATLSFDANGNLTTDETGKTLAYDAWNRLVSVKNGSTTLASYRYDGLGQRVSETVSGTTTDVYFSSAWQVLEEQVGGQTQAQEVWNPLGVDSLVERDRGSERLYAEQDANGNITALVTSSGSVAERYVYDPYGAVTYLTASWSTLSGSAYAWRYLYQAERFDTATGLYNERNRDESPSLGRWLENDPLGFGGGDTNLYRDKGNSPTNNVDPSGLSYVLVRTGPRVGGQRTEHWYYVGTMFGFRRTGNEWIGNHNPQTGLVERNGRFVPAAQVRAAAESWGLGEFGANMPNWNDFFRDRGRTRQDLNESNLHNGNIQEGLWAPDMRNQIAVAQDQINGLARTAINHYATAGLLVGGSRFSFRNNSWYNNTAGRAANGAEIAQCERSWGAFRNVPIPASRAVPTGTTQQILARLPVWREGKPAHGILVVNGRAYYLRSSGPGGLPGYAGNLAPANATELGLGFTGGRLGNVGHVEASAASILRRLALEGHDVSNATLYINLPPCLRGGVGCSANLNRMLPPGTTLNVYGANPQGGRNFHSFFQRFTGSAE
jgi:RHS repeat-associated protein